MKIAVTGATGFVGREILSRKCEIVFIPVTRFLLKKTISEIAFFLKENEIDGILHLATDYVKKHTEEDVERMLESNVVIGSKLLEASILAGIKLFINFGTFFQHINGELYNPANLYAAHKQAFEDICKWYVNGSAIRIIHIKPSGIYGNGDVPYKIIGRLLKAAKTGEEVTMFNPDQEIDTVHVYDVVSAAILSITDNEKYKSGSIFALYSKKRVTLKEFVELFQESTKLKINVVWADGSTATKLQNHIEPLPYWEQTISLDAGLKILV